MRPISAEHPLLLGSASPRRRALVEGLGLPYLVRAPEVAEEVAPGEAPEPYLERIVDAKLARARELAPEAVACSLVADTTVVIGERILGKPSGVGEALELLRALAGRTHRVLTRYAVGVRGGTRALVARTVATQVTIRTASDDELARYAQSGEGLDKAGAYAAQGLGAFLVERVEGSYTNVVGLPVCELVVDLRSAGLLAGFP